MMNVASPILLACKKEWITYPLVHAIILFARSYERPEQLQQLCHFINHINPRRIMAVDPVGESAQRFTELPSSAQLLSQVATKQTEHLGGGRRHTQQSVQALNTRDIDISITCVVDPVTRKHSNIDKHCLHNNPPVFTTAACQIIDSMQQEGLQPINKYLSWNGWASKDNVSPPDNRSWEFLWCNDDLPHRQWLSTLPILTSSHVLYSPIDSYPAYLSWQWNQQIIRNTRQLQNLVVTSDLSLSMLKYLGDHRARCQQAREIGVNIMTFCNHSQGLSQILDHAA